MSRTAWNPGSVRPRGLYRDRENGWLFGVCAGIADYTNLQAITVRVVAALCLIVFFVPTALLYAAAALILRDKPLIYSGCTDEHEFWRGHRRAGQWSQQ